MSKSLRSSHSMRSNPEKTVTCYQFHGALMGHLASTTDIILNNPQLSLPPQTRSITDVDGCALLWPIVPKRFRNAQVSGSTYDWTSRVSFCVLVQHAVLVHKRIKSGCWLKEAPINTKFFGAFYFRSFMVLRFFSLHDGYCPKTVL